MLNHLEGACTALRNIPFQCPQGHPKGTAISVPKGEEEVSADTSASPGIKQGIFALLCPPTPL